MKKFMALMLVLTMALSLAACGGEAKPVETNAPETTVPETTVPETTVPETTEPVVYDTFYYFYDYENNEYVYSDVAVFQDVTGEVCMASALDFGFLTEENYEYMSVGFDDQYAVFMYAYDEAAIDAYVSYLESVGFVYVTDQSFTEGVSHYYQNPQNGFIMDIFAKLDDNGGYEYVALEPCLNKQLTYEESCYYFYDYEAQDYIYSDVTTYQGITGAACIASALDFGFVGNDAYENMTDGYDSRYGVFLYEYDADQLEAYLNYLESIGYTRVDVVEYNEGKSYFYQNTANGYIFDIFLEGTRLTGYEYVAFEPYLNAPTE